MCDYCYYTDAPRNTINFHAGYVNSSAVKAELYRAVPTQHLTDSLLTLRLNTSRMMHTRLFWRPEAVQQMQDYLTAKIQMYGQETKGFFNDVYQSVGQELSGKYSRIASEFSEELAPFVSIIESEMARIERQLDDTRRNVQQMYDRNGLYIQSMGDSFISTL